MSFQQPRPPRNRFFRFAYLMGQRYLRHQVGLHSAALAFYLLFAIFPLLIFFSALIGILQVDIEMDMFPVADLLPSDVLGIVERYLDYVTANPSPRLMAFGLAFSFYFPMRAANSLIWAVREAYHLGRPAGVFGQFIRTRGAAADSGHCADHCADDRQ